MSTITPITAPLPGTFPAQPQNGYPDTNSNYMGGGQYPPTDAAAAGMMPPTIFNPAAAPAAGQPQQQIPGAINYQNFQQNLQYQQQQQQSTQPPANIYNNNFRQQPTPQPAQQTPFVPEPPKQKLPIPEEYIYLQTVFEELKKQCINAAGNPV